MPIPADRLTTKAQTTSSQATHDRIVAFISDIADDVLRNLFKRGKYPDVIMPMCVIRRLEAVLEPTKQAVRKFHEDNNEEAGEHRTSRDAVRLMANLVFPPIATQIKSGTHVRFPAIRGEKHTDTSITLSGCVQGPW